MKNYDWNKVSEILVNCLEIETSERQQYLDGLELDKELRQEVESLLDSEEDVDSSMNLSAVDFSSGFFNGDELENAVAGQQFGAYRVIGELGHGGMGAVYLAERTDGKFEQKVALKLLKREMNTVAIRRRFEQERNILASLEHPNIARLLNAGTTNDKIPYIAMEYVEGLPIDEYCNQHNLKLTSRPFQRSLFSRRFCPSKLDCPQRSETVEYSCYERRIAEIIRLRHLENTVRRNRQHGFSDNYETWSNDSELRFT